MPIRPAMAPRLFAAAGVMRARVVRALRGAPDPGLLLSTHAVLRQEWEAILAGKLREDPLPAGTARASWEIAEEANKAALCLSGGGIRSASFCLGVLQALATAGLLRQFHYLSTVSGGGYIGAWLTGVIARTSGTREAAQILANPADPRLAELRSYTNYLTPSPGLSSADTWAGIVLWVRNTLLNWLVFGPALFAAALAPIALERVIVGATSAIGWAALALGLFLLLCATIAACIALPGHGYRLFGSPRGGPTPVGGVAGPEIRDVIVIPVLLWSLLLPVWVRAVVRHDAPLLPLEFFSWQFEAVSAAVVIVLLAGYVLAMYLLAMGRRRGFHDRDMPPFITNLPWWMLAAVTAAAVLWTGLWLGQSVDLVWLVVLGPVWVVLSHVLQSTVYVGLRRAFAFGDLDREWLARLNAQKVMYVLMWVALAFSTVLMPVILIDERAHTYSVIAGLVGGPVAAWLGGSGWTLWGRLSPPGTTPAWLASMATAALIGLATLAFAIGLLAVFGWAGEHLLDWLSIQPWMPGWTDDLCRAILLFVLSLVLALLFGARININRFSLHGVYRNRLVRAFLGTTRLRRNRRPDAYTEFDPRDNLRMAALRTGALYPVVNVTLNLLTQGRTDWTERKAAPFIITPLHAGADFLSTPHRRGTYVHPENYGGDEREAGPQERLRGISLGTAMTISGAAVSPDMGYHSSPVTSFLMTLFNVRLGAWLPNPVVAHGAELQRGGPSNSLTPLLNEMFGRADDRSANIYLSDGGHFDNLGLYEMLRRKCRLIVVIDAGCDPTYQYEDLGNTLRRASIDLHAEIEFAAPVMKGAGDLAHAAAYARITYKDDNTHGRLIYIKPYIPEYVPADVLAYWAPHPDFPHETTTNQFFTESQFESYRHLGAFIATRAIGDADTLAAWMDAVQQENDPQIPPGDLG